MSLREQMISDIDAVFMQTDDFAETASVNGRTVTLIKDTDTLDGYVKYGIHEGECLIFLRCVDFPQGLDPGSRVMLGSEIWNVKSAEEACGILQVILGRYVR